MSIFNNTTTTPVTEEEQFTKLGNGNTTYYKQKKSVFIKNIQNAIAKKTGGSKLTLADITLILSVISEVADSTQSEAFELSKETGGLKVNHSMLVTVSSTYLQRKELDPTLLLAMKGLEDGEEKEQLLAAYRESGTVVERRKSQYNISLKNGEMSQFKKRKENGKRLASSNK